MVWVSDFFACLLVGSVVSFHTNTGVFNQGGIPGGRAVLSGDRKYFYSFIYLFLLEKKTALLFKHHIIFNGKLIVKNIVVVFCFSL